MKRTVKLTTEQIDMMMSEGIVYDVDNVKENPRMLSVAQNNDGYIGVEMNHFRIVAIIQENKKLLKESENCI